MNPRQFLLLFVMSAVTVVRGQFYAPETDYHDNAQRVFPVEAARVLAWVRNSAGANIADVDYSLVTTAEHETAWTIRWRDAAGKVIREKAVKYPESALTSGPDFYRDVFRQLTADDWKLESAPPDNAATAFWQGAEAASGARLEGLKAASNLLKDKPKMARPADCARLAGMLAHSTLPRLGTPVTIDAVLLARGAAWLCFAEGLSREKFDAAWATIIALSWREKDAGSLWSNAPKRALAKMSPAERFWNQLLSHPSAKDMYVFAARPENRAFAAPAIIYPGALDDEWALVTVKLANDLVGSEMASRMNEYLPSLVLRGGPGGGRLGAAAPGQFLESFEHFLRDFQPGPSDFTGYREALDKLSAGKPAESSDHAALQRLAPVLNLGLDQGAGALVPVAHVTTRDLLGYGWEMTGIQFGAEHRFLAKSPGDPNAAKKLGATALGAIKGMDAFFPEAQVQAVAPLADLSRLQAVGSSAVHRALSKKLPAAWAKSPDTYLRRIWLSRVVMREAIESFVLSKGPEEGVKTNVERLIKESGPQVLQSLAVSEPGDRHPAVLNRLGLRNSLTDEEPWIIRSERARIWEGTGQKGDILGFAQGLEKAGWNTGISTADQLILIAYLEANAIQSAKCFYSQVRPFVVDDATFSRTTGAQRFALAWWENDDAGMKQALKDSSTSSWSDLKLQACYAVLAGDLAGAEKAINAMIERDGDEGGGQGQLKEYLALVPALKDPNHPDHAKAVNTFPHLPSWRLLQWILLKQAALSDPEAVRFLGGDHAPADNRVLIAYVNRDKPSFEKEFEAHRWQNQNAESALIAMMRNDLLGIEPPSDQPDLMPAGAKPLPQLIAEARKAGPLPGSEPKYTLDYSKFKTAQEFWVAIEQLRSQPREPSDSPEDLMRRTRARLLALRAAADAFLKAYPDDPHRHAAKLIAIDAGVQLGQFGDPTAKLPDKNELEAILASPDADETAKGNAEFFLVMHESQSVSFNSPHTVPPFQQALSGFLEKYPKHERAGYVASLLLQILSQFETPSTEPLLRKLTTNPIEEVAAQAKVILQERQFMAELKKKPLDLKFTAVDGTQVDAARLRGKVVLLDFWASACGQCMADAPQMVATYQKLRDQGFEIIGINLDETKEELTSAAQRVGMTWPQYFDGKGWMNDVAQRFGVHSIPSIWIFDRQGKLREHDLHGGEIEARVENLLKEK